MTTIFRFAVIGLGAGSLYALAAIGLVLVFRGSKVVNFAQGAMGMMAAYVFYELHQNWHLSVVLAIPAGLLVSAALGAAFFYFVIRQLKNASNLIKIVATLALFVVTQEAMLLIFGAAAGPSRRLPTSSVSIFGASDRRGPPVDLRHRHRAHGRALVGLQVHDSVWPPRPSPRTPPPPRRWRFPPT